MYSKDEFQWERALTQKYFNENQFEKLNNKDSLGWTGFIIACFIQPELAFKMLERDDIDFNTKSNNNTTGFIMACEKNPELALKMLKRNDIDFNTQSKKGQTGFMIACEFQPELALEMLKKNDIDFNAQNYYTYETGFMIACFHHPKLIIPMLENKKINTSLKNSDCKTGWDIVKENNPKGFEIYKAYLEQQKIKSNIKSENKIKKSKPLL